jgi:hypothetical protein
MKQYCAIFMAALFPLFNLCDHISNPPQSETIYFNSFETAADTLGWQGISTKMFTDEPAPGLGQKSLLISGGCIQPAASLLLASSPTSGENHLSCWGKKGAVGGAIQLSVYSDREVTSQLRLHIDSDDWKFYEVTGKLDCPSSSILKLEMWVGGIIFNSMYVDGLKVELFK